MILKKNWDGECGNSERIQSDTECARGYNCNAEVVNKDPNHNLSTNHCQQWDREIGDIR